MKLTNCYSEREKMLNEIELQGLDNKELVELARKIKAAWNQCIMQDEEIVIDALAQISEELGGRLNR